MSRLRSDQIEQVPQTSIEKQSSAVINNDEHDNQFVPNTTLSDLQANIRRRAPTRHSIKSLSRKSPKQNSVKEVIIKKISFI